jgi:hypothetical protein
VITRRILPAIHFDACEESAPFIYKLITVQVVIRDERKSNIVTLAASVSSFVYLMIRVDENELHRCDLLSTERAKRYYITNEQIVLVIIMVDHVAIFTVEIDRVILILPFWIDERLVHTTQIREQRTNHCVYSPNS